MKAHPCRVAVFRPWAWASKGSCLLPVVTAGPKSTGLCDIDAGATGLAPDVERGANVNGSSAPASRCASSLGRDLHLSNPNDGGPIYADAAGTRRTARATSWRTSRPIRTPSWSVSSPASATSASRLRMTRAPARSVHPREALKEVNSSRLLWLLPLVWRRCGEV